MWAKHVYSSNVQEVGYNPETHELFITWARGKRSIYAEVPEELAVQLSNAPSVGSMLNAEIKPYYEHHWLVQHHSVFGRWPKPSSAMLIILAAPLSLCHLTILVIQLRP